jgi:hypothetical protein
MRLCFVLLPDAKPLLQSALEKALKEFPELGKVTGFKATREGGASFKVAKLSLVTMLMPAPVPDGEADEATERSLSGLSGSWSMPEHRAHLVLVQEGAKDGDLAQLVSFTRVAAAIVRATGAIALYWGEARATHHPEFVVNIAHSEIPLPLWAGLSVASKGKGFELLSVGMHQLELPDLLLNAPSLEGETLEFFYDLLAYITRRGKALPEGETVGRDDKERLKIKYVPSPLDAKQKVWSITLPAPKVKKPAKAKPPARKKTKK